MHSPEHRYDLASQVREAEAARAWQARKLAEEAEALRALEASHRVRLWWRFRATTLWSPSLADIYAVRRLCSMRTSARMYKCRRS